LLIVEIADYKDEILERHQFNIPSAVYGEPNYKVIQWDLDIDMSDENWSLKIKDSTLDDGFARTFYFEDKKLGIKADFDIKREKYLYAGNYIVHSCDFLDASWWHQERKMGLQASGDLTWNGKERT